MDLGEKSAQGPSRVSRGENCRRTETLGVNRLAVQRHRALRHVIAGHTITQQPQRDRSGHGPCSHEALELG